MASKLLTTGTRVTLSQYGMRWWYACQNDQPDRATRRRFSAAEVAGDAGVVTSHRNRWGASNGDHRGIYYQVTFQKTGRVVRMKRRWLKVL